MIKSYHFLLVVYIELVFKLNSVIIFSTSLIDSFFLSFDMFCFTALINIFFGVWDISTNSIS